MSKVALGALVASVAVFGCVGPRAHLEDVASRQHGCPRDRTHVTSSAGHWTYWVDVCGRRRLYSMQEGRVEDITSSVGGGSSGGASFAPDRRSSSGFGSPRWTRHELNGFVETSARAVDACFPDGHGVIRVSVSIGGDGAVDYARPLGDMPADDRECVTSAVMDARMGPTHEASATTSLLEYPAAGPPTAPPPAGLDAPAPGTDEAGLRHRIDVAGPAVLACVGGDSAAVELTISPAGEVVAGLRGDLSGGPEEGCVRAAIGAISMSPPPGVELVIVHAVVR